MQKVSRAHEWTSARQMPSRRRACRATNASPHPHISPGAARARGRRLALIVRHGRMDFGLPAASDAG